MGITLYALILVFVECNLLAPKRRCSSDENSQCTHGYIECVCDGANLGIQGSLQLQHVRVLLGVNVRVGEQHGETIYCEPIIIIMGVITHCISLSCNHLTHFIFVKPYSPIASALELVRARETMWVALLIVRTITKFPNKSTPQLKVPMAQAHAGATAIRAAKDALRKRLKKALAGLSEQEKLEQSKKLVKMVKVVMNLPYNCLISSILLLS